MNRFMKITLSMVILGLMVWGSIYAYNAYANRQKLQQLLASAQDFKPGERPDREAREARRKELESLPQEVRDQFFANRRESFMAAREQEMEAFFKMSKADRIKELDKRIAEDEARHKRREQERKDRQTQAAANGGSNSNGGRNGQGGNGQQGNNANGQNGNTDGGPGGGPWGRERGLAARLDNTTPQFRAMMGAYRMEMSQRRAELGLPVRASRRNYL